MRREKVYTVQFIGGPFDGHVQAVRIRPCDLAKLVALPVSREIFQTLAGDRPAPETLVTSEALYQLESTRNSPCYRFLKAIAPVPTQTGS